MSDPMEPMRRLRERLIEQVEPMGLHIVGFAIIPGGSGLPDHVQAIFEIDQENVGKEIADIEIDKEVESFRAELAQAERDAKFESAKERMKRLAESGGGFLGPMEDPQ